MVRGSVYTHATSFFIIHLYTSFFLPVKPFFRALKKCRRESADGPSGHLSLGVRRRHGLQRLRPGGTEGQAGALPPRLPRLRRDPGAQGHKRRLPGGATNRRQHVPGVARIAELHPRGLRSGIEDGR